MSCKNFCMGCDLFDTCEFADCINFCDNCKDGDICNIRTESCAAGHDTECNNGYEEDEEEDEL